MGGGWFEFYHKHWFALSLKHIYGTYMDWESTQLALYSCLLSYTCQY